MKAKLSRYFKLILILCPVLILILIIIQFVSISRFNSHVYTVKGQDDSLKTWMDLDPRKDSTSSWLKRDFEWDGETLDLKAPTHDLGKITIENAILNKPGKLTDEEYAAMKTHAPKSGEMVMILLDGVEEERFVKVAYNVARFHHERWDGRGYPDGLVGSMIPLEARIMAAVERLEAYYAQANNSENS